MKLNLLFIVMDLLILLAYPVVFVHGRLLQFSKSRERVAMANLKLLVPVSVAPGK